MPRKIIYSKLIPLIFIIAGCTKTAKQDIPSTGIPSNYFQLLSKHRTEQNVFFRGPQSPLIDSVKQTFPGISYFDPDTNYRVIATLEKIENGRVFQMETTGAIADHYKTVGKLHFTVSGKEQALEIYENQELKESGHTFNFIPFFDLTNDKETYGGGRYLDIPDISGREIIIDFNYAYQPYCAYNHDYSCPIPPAVNRLDVAIKAGERMQMKPNN